MEIQVRDDSDTVVTKISAKWCTNLGETFQSSQYVNHIAYKNLDEKYKDVKTKFKLMVYKTKTGLKNRNLHIKN